MGCLTAPVRPRGAETRERDPWERFWTTRGSAPHDIYPNSPRIARLLRAGEGRDPVVEVGCGTGRDSVRLARAGRRVVVVDRSPKALALARLFARENEVTLAAILADARHLPFRAGSIGTLFHQGVLEHFRDPDTLLQENHRVLCHGGTLLVDVPQTFHPWTALKKALIPLGLWFGGWETQYTPRGLARVVTRAGFQVRTVYGEWMDPPLLYRLIRELLRRTGLWRLPLFPKGIGLIRLARRIDARLLGGWLERWTGHVVGVVAVKKAPP